MASWATNKDTDVWASFSEPPRECEDLLRAYLGEKVERARADVAGGRMFDAEGLFEGLDRELECRS